MSTQPQRAITKSTPAPKPQHLRKVIEQLEVMLGEIGDNRDCIGTTIEHYS